SDRDGPLPTVVAPGSLEPLGRASEPRMRIVFGEVSGEAPPVSCEAAALEIFVDWICALTRNSTSETSSQAPTASATHLKTRPGVILPPPVPRRSRGNRRLRRPWTS